MKEQEPKFPAAEHITLFGRFALRRVSRTLCLDGRPVSLNDRAMDVLIALVDARGRIVPVGDLLQDAPEVASNSVQALVSQLRRALGEDRDLIETVPRRGYRLATEWYEIRDEVAPQTTEAHFADTPSFDEQASVIEAKADDVEPTPLIGRDAELSELLMRVSQHRLVTLMGALGVGKTRLAREAAQRSAALFETRVHCVDLGAPVLPERIAEYVAAQLRVPRAHAGIEAIAASFEGKSALVVIDHGDALAHELAPVIEALLANTQASVIVCAEAPLFVSGEYLLPLAPLRFIAHHADEPTLSDACRFFITQLRAPALQLEMEAVCRAVSGNPLAMQLAAQHIQASLHHHASLDDALADWEQRFRLAHMHRTGANGATVSAANAVHAVIALAFHALDTSTRDALSRMSLFTQPVSFDIGKQARESGLVNDHGDTLSMMPAVRDFILAHFAHDAAFDDAAARHAQWLVENTRGVAHIADLRRALGWSVEAGRIDMAARLLQTSADTWNDAQLIGEQLHWIARTLDHPAAQATLKVRDHMLLALALAQGQQRMRPEHSPIDAVAAWWRVYDLATACADDKTRLAALSVLFLRTLQAGYGDARPDLLEPVRERVALECEGASAHPGFKLLRGVLMTLDGRHEDAIAELAPHAHIEQLESTEHVDEDAQPAPRYIAAVSHNALAISLWLTGARTSSHPALLQALTDARQQSDPVSRCAAAALACVLFLLEENAARIAQQARLVCAISKQHGLAGWEPVGRSFLLWAEADQGSKEAAQQLTDRALVNIERRHSTLIDLLALERFAAIALHDVGAGALLRLYDGMVANLESSGRRWLLPEALRVSAVLRRHAGMDDREVMPILEQASDAARRQRATRLARRIAAVAAMCAYQPSTDTH
jgi:DNA-binding winged helix-turn-helix (wHTH) protein/predicted ATPase